MCVYCIVTIQCKNGKKCAVKDLDFDSVNAIQFSIVELLQYYIHELVITENRPA